MREIPSYIMAKRILIPWHCNNVKMHVPRLMAAIVLPIAHVIKIDVGWKIESLREKSPLFTSTIAVHITGKVLELFFLTIYSSFSVFEARKLIINELFIIILIPILSVRVWKLLWSQKWLLQYMRGCPRGIQSETLGIQCSINYSMWPRYRKMIFQSQLMKYH